MRVPFLHASAIEAETLTLLAEYGRRFGEVRTGPVPVEEILEAHLGLEFGFDDLPKKLGIPNVLGATWIEARRVVVDQSLDPTIHPQKEGRFRFTIAHELGHWALHRHLLQADKSQLTLFDLKDDRPSIVCRSRSKEPIERQADAFAGLLLMPKAMVLEAWTRLFGSAEPHIATEEMTELKADWTHGPNVEPTVMIARELAAEFRVSGQAMQIRLVELGLLSFGASEAALFGQQDNEDAPLAP